MTLMASCPSGDWTGEVVDTERGWWWLPDWLKRTRTMRCPKCKLVIAKNKLHRGGWRTGVQQGSIWNSDNPEQTWVQ